MSTAIGSRMVNGSGTKCSQYTQGQGLARDIASKVVRFLGHKAVDYGADIVNGSGVKITGTGKKKRVHKTKTHRKRR